MHPLSLLVILLVALPGCVTNGPVAVAHTVPTGFPVACAPDQVQVMLLGTYHFANPGADTVNPTVDDMLVPRRQAELDELAVRLARWRPQQVAIEAPFDEIANWQSRYVQYRAGTLSPSRNEIVQIGFRLAHKLDHSSVYPIDYQMRIGNDSVAALYERRPELQTREEGITAMMRARMERADMARMSTTVTEHLRDANSEAALRGGNSFGMFGALMPAGEGDNYGGPQVIAKWYERNIRMAHHLHRILEPGTDRMLVIVGSGHVPPMRNILDEDPKFCPVSPLSYLH